MSYVVDDAQMGAALALVALLGLAPGVSVSWTVHDDGSLSASAHDDESFAALAGLLDAPRMYVNAGGRSARAMWRGVTVSVWSHAEAVAA